MRRRQFKRSRRGGSFPRRRGRSRAFSRRGRAGRIRL